MVQEQGFLEHLQASDHGRKRRVVFLGSSMAMIMIVVLWIFGSTLFREKTEEKTAFRKPDFSLWKSVEGESMLVAQATIDHMSSIQSLLGKKKTYVVTPAK